MGVFGNQNPPAGGADKGGVPLGPPPPSPEQVLWDKVAYFDYTTTFNKGERFTVQERAKLSAESANAFLEARDKLCNAGQFEEEPELGSLAPKE